MIMKMKYLIALFLWFAIEVPCHMGVDRTLHLVNGIRDCHKTVDNSVRVKVIKIDGKDWMRITWVEDNKGEILKTGCNKVYYEGFE